LRYVRKIYTLEESPLVFDSRKQGALEDYKIRGVARPRT